MYTYDDLKEMNLNIDITRGKPCAEQLNLSNPMLEILNAGSDFKGADGVDVRNYGILEGISEARQLMADIMEANISQTLVIGSSALQIIYDTVQRCMQFGSIEGKPWNVEGGRIKFLCPAPGYDRHFDICEAFGIEMIRIDFKGSDPDIEKIEELCESDDSIKGIFCVPKYSNPTGGTYSDEFVRRLASMKAADDFRIFWDNAYCVHHIYDDDRDVLLDIASACENAGNNNRYYKFASFSKVTFPGASIAAFASSEVNVENTQKHMSAQMIGSDKINQLRHVRFLSDMQAVEEHMKKHASIIRPKFELIASKLESGLRDVSGCDWSNPRGGYFISFNTPANCATRTVEIAGELGVKFQAPGSTYPYKDDPLNRNIRLAPTMPSIDDLELACDVLICALKRAIEENS